MTMLGCDPGRHDLGRHDPGRHGDREFREFSESKESREVPQKILKKLDFNFKLDIIKSGFLILDS